MEVDDCLGRAPLPDINSFSTVADAAGDLDTLGSVTSRFAADYGYPLVACGRLTGRFGPRLFDFNTWPEDLIARYVTEGLVGNDPSPLWGLRSGSAIGWNDLQALMPRGHPCHRVAAIAREWDIFGGLVVPTRRMDGTLGLVTFAGKADPVIPKALNDLRLLAILATERADVLLNRTGPSRLTPPQVTERERDCLENLVQGRTDKEIAAILGISETTARFHIDNVRRKLGAATRGQLGALAVTLGYVGRGTAAT